MLLDLPAYDHSADSRLEVRSFLLFFGKALIFNISFSLVYVRGEEVFIEQAVLKENPEALVRPLWTGLESCGDTERLVPPPRAHASPWERALLPLHVRCSVWWPGRTRVQGGAL